MILQFDTCDTKMCVDVPIVDDDVNEPPIEDLFYILNRTNGLTSSITLDSVIGEIEIEDNDG